MPSSSRAGMVPSSISSCSPRVHAAIDGHLATARGPWSDGPFVSAVLHLLASAPERAA